MAFSNNFTYPDWKLAENACTEVVGLMGWSYSLGGVDFKTLKKGLSLAGYHFGILHQTKFCL